MSEEALSHRAETVGPTWYRWLVAFPAKMAHRLAALIFLPIMTLVVSTEVLARYFLHMPLSWAQDFSTLVLLCFFVSAMIIAAERDANIRVETLYERFGPGTQAAIEVLGNLAGVIFCLLLAYSELHDLPGMIRREESSPVANLPHWPPSLLTAVAGILTAWVLCAKAYLAAESYLTGGRQP
jgi:TRAP-type C4-dicarboxylate transport system permease small subunit